MSGISDNTALIGTCLGGKYEILSLLGEGGMGVVFKARHQLMKRIVAIKMLHPHLADQGKIKRFRQEAEAAAKLSHPNVITVFEFDITEQGRPYLVMDFLEGVSLSDVIKEQGRVPLERMLELAIQACEGLGHAHSNGIVHRDLKPSNIMLVQTEEQWDSVKIVDFGIAKIIPIEGEDLQKLTQTGELFGSPCYMSPEQCMGLKLDARSDIYSFGCLLYESLVGVPPFKSSHMYETFHKHLNEMPPALVIPGSCRAVLERLDAVVFKTMEKNPDKRYQSMAELRADLEEIQKVLRGGPNLWAAFTGNCTQLLRSMRRTVAAHPKLAGALVVLLVTGFAATGITRLYGILIQRGPAEQEMVWQRKGPTVQEMAPGMEGRLDFAYRRAMSFKQTDDPFDRNLLNGLETVGAPTGNTVSGTRLRRAIKRSGALITGNREYIHYRW